MDAVTLLKADHQAVEAHFKKFEQAGPRARQTKARLVKQIVKELSVHAVIEEEVLYPVLRSEVPDLEPLVLESLEEHHVVKWLCSELDGLDPSNERFDAKTTVLIESVRRHVREEERDVFPRVRRALGRNRLAELGDLLVQAKKVAPPRPHPRAPDTPPGNLVAGMAASALDKVRDAVSR